MTIVGDLVSELLPDPGDWEPVAVGQSGALVFRGRRGQRYAKLVSSEHVAELAAERDRLVWLNQQPVPSSRVLDWRQSDVGACLVTQALPGLPASHLDPTALLRSWPSIVETVRALHDLDTATCPFDRGIAHMMSLAEAGVAEGRTVVEFLPEHLQSTPPAHILEQIRSELPLRLGQERTDLVVCHGDLCLPNIVVDPTECRVEGLIDVGRLGTADPYGDIALLLATPLATWPDAATAHRAEQEFAALYGTDLDPDRQDFYLRLDPLTW
jgi:streptomycin 3"-kinase